MNPSRGARPEQLPALSLDLTGMPGPLPIVNAARAIRQLHSGELLEVLVTDASSILDFTAWCQGTGNGLVGRSEENGVLRFVVQKK